MKKIVLSLLAFTGLFLSSCNVGNGDNYQNVAYYPTNLIIPTDGSPAVMSQGVYPIKFDFNDGTATVSGALRINETDYSFVADPVKYVDYGYKQVIKGVSGMFSNGSQEMRNGKFMISAYDALPKDFNPTKVFTPIVKNENAGTKFIPGVLITPVSQSVSAIFVGYYQMGDRYNVHTFSTDTFYAGTTNTGYATSDKTVYRVIMDIEKKKATLLIYDAKFAEEMPSIKTIILPELDIVTNSNGYEIVGENIVPLVPEADSTMAELSQCTPNEAFIFNSFRMNTVDQLLTKVNMDYRVAGRFNGKFSGSYVNLPDGF